MKKTDGKIQKNAEISQFWHAIPLSLQRVDAEKKRHHRIFALVEVEDMRGGLEGQSIERASKTVQTLLSSTRLLSEVDVDVDVLASMFFNVLLLLKFCFF